MTKHTISDEEVTWACRHMGANEHDATVRGLMHNTLADFFARRVPDAMPRADESDIAENIYRNGFNACRDIVLRGGK